MEEFRSPEQSPGRDGMRILPAELEAPWRALEAQQQQRLAELQANMQAQMDATRQRLEREFNEQQAKLHANFHAEVEARARQLAGTLLDLDGGPRLDGGPVLGTTPQPHTAGPSPAPARPAYGRPPSPMARTPQPSATSGPRYGRLRPQPEFMRLFQQLKQLKASEGSLGKDGIKAAPLDKFSGEKNTVGLREWLQRYYGHPGQPSVQSLGTYLSGKAATWYGTQTSLRQEVWTLDELVEALAIRFDDPSSSITARAELKSLKQGRDDILNFNQRYLEVATTANALDDADIIARYSGAVNAATLQIIITNKWHTDRSITLTELMALVQGEVQSVNEFHAHIRSVTDGASITGRSDYNVRYSEPMAATSDPMELGTMRMNQQFAGGQCFRCHGYGHWADQCATPDNADERLMQLQCHKCKGWGHMQGECKSPEQRQMRPKSPYTGQQQHRRYQAPHQRAQSPRGEQQSRAQSPRGGQHPTSPARWQKSGDQQANGFNNLRNYRPRGRGRGRGRQASN